MDIKWIVDQAVCMANNGGCKETAVETIINAIALSEQETIDQYACVIQGIINVYGDDPKAKVLVKMVENVIADERNHAASANKAAALIKGTSVPKADEYDKAVKEVE